MNKTKRGLQLGAAITSIAFSALLALGSLLIIGTIADATSGMYGDPELSMAVSTLRAIYICIILFAAANIIVSSMICAKPQDGGTHKGLMITSLVLNSILVVLYIAGGSFYAIFPMACVGLYIAALCVKNDISQSATATTPTTNVNNSVLSVNNSVSADNDMPNLTAVANQLNAAVISSNNSEVEKSSETAISNDKAEVKDSENVRKYKKMFADGIITEDEMNSLINADKNK